MNLIDKEFMPLSEVSIVETPDKDSHVLIENFGEVRRAPMKSIGGETSGIVRFFIEDPTLQPDENDTIEIVKIVEADEVQNYINKYKNGSIFMLSVDYIKFIKETDPSLEVPEGMERYMDLIGMGQKIDIYNGEKGKVFGVGTFIDGATILFGWATSRELWDELKNLL